MSTRATWKKAEKLKSRKRIDRVFREGKSFSVFPYKVVFLVGTVGAAASPASGAQDAGPGALPSGARSDDRASRAHYGAPLQAGFGASSRNFKKAVDRNRIKRLGREAYRLQKAPLLEQLTAKGLSMAVFFVFIGRELPDYPIVSARIGVALQKLLKETA
jgi:ribonuclease P protein component